MMGRIGSFLYGVASYAVFFGTFLYAVGFLGNFGVPKSIDSAPQGSLAMAIVVDLGLLGLFALQHSGMARRGFKRWWTRVVPTPIERSTYVLLSSLALILLFWQWQPIGGVVWDVAAPAGRVALWSLFGLGWGIVLVSTFLINHFDLFGLRQVWLHLRGKEITPLRFRTPGPYKLVRHPLYVGWLCVMWATPTMSIAHLVFALASSAYILVAIQFEERDLLHFLGKDYALYRDRVPMLIPAVGRRQRSLDVPAVGRHVA